MQKVQQQAAQGLTWAAIESGGVRAITFLVFVVFTRLLDSEDIGLFAMAMIYVAFVELVVRVGITEVIVQRQELENIHKDTGFWFTATLGVVAYLVSITFASHAASWKGDPKLAEIISWLAMGVIPLSLTRVQEGLLLREMQFRKLAKRSLIATLAGGISGIVVVAIGYGIWGLVVQQLVDRFIGFLVLYRVTAWRPRLKFSYARLKEMLGYGGKVMGSNITQFFNMHVDRLLIGSLLGMGALGVYIVGRRIVDVFLQTLTMVFARVALSAFARMQADERASAFLIYTRRTAFFSLPILFIFLIASEPVTLIIFGEKWTPAAPICGMVVLSALFHATMTFASPLLKAVGQPGKVLMAMLGRTVASIVLAYLASPYGLLPMTAGWIVGELVSPLLLMIWLGSIKGVTIKAVLKSIRFSFLSSGVSAITAASITHIYLDDVNPLVLLLSMVFIFAVVYLAMLRLLEKEEYALASAWLGKQLFQLR